MKTIIDLTYHIEEGMPTTPCDWHPKVSIQQLGRLHLEGRETRKFTLGSHTGTHMDAPKHFIKGGRAIDEIPLTLLIGDVSIVDFSHLGKNAIVTKEMMQKIDLTERMLFKFGWAKQWNTKQFYHDWPFFTAEAAHYIVSKGVKLIGIDTPAPDNSNILSGNEKDSEIHKIFLGSDIVLIEYLNLEEVKEYSGWKLLALPLKIKDSDGSPIRACIYK